MRERSALHLGGHVEVVEWRCAVDGQSEEPFAGRTPRRRQISADRSTSPAVVASDTPTP